MGYVHDPLLSFSSDNGDGGLGSRRLPNVPSPRPSVSSGIQRESGWVQFGLTFEEPNLMITLWGAEGLRMVESANDVALPKPYAIVRLCMFG